ncbi:TRAF3-interacting protein 1-like [Gossypium hirsutum]|uniref:TRAF3-interacting protein 1-like n=1 Tax=Gossypium hirsutum TaxID=3635 RepID=A0ABM3BLP8_GOSHI|nr:TRAF3-interacting protein 1-like [Gossypium hirsutum]
MERQKARVREKELGVREEGSKARRRKNVLDLGRRRSKDGGREREERKEEDRDDLKEHYKKEQISLRRVRVGGSSDQLQKEVQEEKARAEYWQRKFHEMQSQNSGELHQSRGQVRERDHVIGEAVAQIRGVAEYVQDLAIRADVLSLMYSSSSDIGQELALLLDRVKTLGIKAKVYL